MDLSLQHCDREKSRLAIDGLSSYGQLRMSASGVSMLPTILPGDSLLIERATLNEVTRGDIVLYSRGDSLFIHRLIQLDLGVGSFVTRGDSMAAPDPAGPKDLLGKVVAIGGVLDYAVQRDVFDDLELSHSLLASAGIGNCSWNHASHTGVSRATIHRKLKIYNLSG